jgi:hypothetical protein
MRAIAVAGVSLMLLSSGAFAQTKREQADALFKEGRAAAQAADFATACSKFTASQKLDPSTGTLLNLGDCEEHQGHLTVARNYYQDALRQLGATDPRNGPAKERLASLESRIPRIVVRASASPGATVTLDGVPVSAASLDAPIPVDPGQHTLVVTAPDHDARRTVLDLAETRSVEFVAEPGPAVAGPATPPGPGTVDSPPPPRRTSSSTAATVGWIVGGVGVVGLGLAAVSGAIIIGEKNTVESHCPRGKDSCDDEGARAASANRTWLPVNVVAWIVGVAGVGAGAYLLLTSRSKVSVGARVLPGGGVLDARVLF